MSDGDVAQCDVTANDPRIEAWIGKNDGPWWTKMRRMLVYYYSNGEQWPGSGSKEFGSFITNVRANLRNAHGPLTSEQRLFLRKIKFPATPNRGGGMKGAGTKLAEMLAKVRDGTISKSDLNTLRKGYGHGRLPDEVGVVLREHGHLTDADEVA